MTERTPRPLRVRLDVSSSGLRVSRLLVLTADDPGCTAVFEALDAYVDAVLHGHDVKGLYAQLLTHLRNCEECREDAEGLLTVIRTLDPAA